MQTKNASIPAPGFKKNPEHKIDIKQTGKQATAKVSGKILATSQQAITLTESQYPDTLYFPREDVRMDLLNKSNTSSCCPFKGTASYWHLAGDDKNTPEIIDICWSYEEPFKEAVPIGNYIAFYRDKVTVT